MELNKGTQKDEQMRTATVALTTPLLTAHTGLLMAGATAISGPLMLFIIPIAALSIINAISNAIEKAEKRQEIEAAARRDMRQANIEGKRNLQRKNLRGIQSDSSRRFAKLRGYRPRSFDGKRPTKSS